MGALLVVDGSGRVGRGDTHSGERVILDGGPNRGMVATAVSSASGAWEAWSIASPADAEGPREIRLQREGEADAHPLVTELTAIYLCPSPDGRYLSHLSPGPLGLELSVSDTESGALVVVERGQPLFWSWSPDSARIAVHVEDRVSVVELAEVGEWTNRELCRIANPFLVPWWLGDDSVAVPTDEGGLHSVALDGSSAPLVEGTERVAPRFAVDPQGRRVAAVQWSATGPILAIVDLLTGEHTEVTTERTAGFFWSPEGRHLAALVVGGMGQLQWLVHSGDGVTRRLAPFRPGGSWVREVLPFFEQYAQSHRVWSGDGTCLVVPAVDRDGSSEALVQAVAGGTTDAHLPDCRLAWWTAEEPPAES